MERRGSKARFHGPGPRPGSGRPPWAVLRSRPRNARSRRHREGDDGFDRVREGRAARGAYSSMWFMTRSSLSESFSPTFVALRPKTEVKMRMNPLVNTRVVKSMGARVLKPFLPCAL